MKKLLIALSLIVVILAGCGTTVDKKKYPEGGILILIGYDKSLYFKVNKKDDIDRSTDSSAVSITYGKDRTFTTNDVFYEYPYHNQQELHDLLKQFKFEK